MSILAITFPAGAARSLIGLGIFVTLLMLFKPMIVGMLRAALLLVAPRKSLEQRQADNNMQSVLMLNRMARELDLSQPSLAAELRLLAARG